MTKNEKDLDNLLQLIKEKTGMNQDEIAKRVNYNRSYLSQAKKKDSDKLYGVLYNAFKDVLENLTTEAQPIKGAKDVDHPTMQAILDLTYSSRKTADGIEKMADANLANARSIEVLVQILATNLGVSGLKGLSLAGLQRPDVPAEAFLSGKPLSGQTEDTHNENRNKTRGK